VQQTTHTESCRCWSDDHRHVTIDLKQRVVGMYDHSGITVSGGDRGRTIPPGAVMCVEGPHRRDRRRLSRSLTRSRHSASTR
jgi:hypothetical protein